jgi:gamma-glutamyltranspeptidase/glutathione hydrolase
MLVGSPDGEDVLLDFFVEAPNRAGRTEFEPLRPVDVPFGDVIQVFHVGPSSCGTYGMPHGICTAHARYARLPLAELAAPGIRLAREGVRVNRQQAYIFEILAGITGWSAEGRALYGERAPAEGEVVAHPELAEALERLAAEGSEPFYTGDIARAVCEWLEPRGGVLGAEDLAAYATISREPVRVAYRSREVVSNPPPSAGGTLIASALEDLGSEPGPPDVGQLVAAMQRAQERRTPEFLARLAALGNTTHVSTMDADGWACSVTVSNGASSGVIVPGTGLHLNNMLGEEDLNPLGFHHHEPGRRLPSMMSPTLVRREGIVELALGSAGSNRIRSAILQLICGVVDRGLEISEAVEAPRVHWEDGTVFAEPGVDVAQLGDRPVVQFPTTNVFFGGAQAVQRLPGGPLVGAGDSRRGGAAVSVEA